MIIRAIDSNGDWTFGKGLSSYKKDLAGLSQNIKTRLLEWKGDCFFDNAAGVDWKTRLGKSSQLKPLIEEVRTVILKTDGVLQVINLDANLNSNRKLTISYSVKTVFGETQDNVPI